MSTTFTVVCDKCKRRIWAGQSTAGGPVRIYENTGNWMREHMGHPLRFLVDCDSNDTCSDDYEDDPS